MEHETGVKRCCMGQRVREREDWAMGGLNSVLSFSLTAWLQHILKLEPDTRLVDYWHHHRRDARVTVVIASYGDR